MLLYILHSTVYLIAIHHSSNLATHILHSTVYLIAAHNSSNLATHITQHCISKCCTPFLKSCYLYITALYIIVLCITPQILLHILHSTIYHSAVQHPSNLATHFTQHYISECCTTSLQSCITYDTALYIMVLQIIPPILHYI